MNGTFTDSLVHQWLQVIADNAFVSLHYDTPALADKSSAELSGGGYVRVRVPFSQPTNRSIWSLDDAKFTGLPQGQVTHFGIWDGSLFESQLLAYAPLPEKAVFPSGHGFILRTGEISISIG